MIHPYVDRQLDVVQAAEVDRHLAQCEDCNARYQLQAALRSSFEDDSLYYRAPVDLKARIRARLQQEEATEIAESGIIV